MGRQTPKGSSSSDNPPTKPEGAAEAPEGGEASSSTGGDAAAAALELDAARAAFDKTQAKQAELDEREATLRETEARKQAELDEREAYLRAQETRLADERAAFEETRERAAFEARTEARSAETAKPAVREARAEPFYRGTALVIPRAAFLAHGPCEQRSFNVRATAEDELVYPHGLDQSTEAGLAELRELAERNPGGLLWLARKRLIPVSELQAREAVRDVHGIDPVTVLMRGRRSRSSAPRDDSRRA